MNVNLDKLRQAGVDVDTGLKYTMLESIYVKSLEAIRDVYDEKIAKLNKCIEDEDLKGYTIEAHSLKSTAKLIGAERLAEEAYKMELAGKEDSLEKVKSGNPILIETYQDLLRIFEECSDD